MKKNPKCWHYKAKDPDDKANCPNCKHWGGEKCMDEHILIKHFDAYDRMMKSNKGVRLDG